MIEQDEIISHFASYLTQQGSSKKTQKNYCADIEDFLSWVSTELSISELSVVKKSEIEKYLESQKALGKSVATMNRRLSSLRVFYTFLTTSKPNQQNPMEHISNVVVDEVVLQHQQVIQAYEAKLRGEGKNPSAVSNHKTVVVEFLKWIKRHHPS